MKILFVSSGNSIFGISPIVKAQGESLIKAGAEIEYYTVVGKGYKGYINNIFRLKKHLRSKSFDIVHSHFFLSSLVAAFSKPKKLVVSLMGSDVYNSKFWNYLIRRFSKKWNALIVKSEKMKDILGLENVNVIPNGVDTSLFYPVEKIGARKELGWNENKKYILFASHPERPEKNFQLANDAVAKLKIETELVTIKDIPQEKIVYYLNACDLLLMTSQYEGSPNIIKEAMACNCPIVSTDVGDVKWVIGETDGCYITSFDVKEVSEKIMQALSFAENAGRTKGRGRIIELGLDSETIAKKIIDIYNRV